MKRIVKWKHTDDSIAYTGVTYYLDTVNGSDDNSGLSKTQAWKTLAYAEEQITNGDVLLLAYASQLEFPKATFSDFISFRMNNIIYNPLHGYNITVSRTSGVAPLSIHFDVTPTDMSHYHSMEFQWNFGDSESGTWHDGKSKNTAKGPIACHIFESAGSYTITLTIKEGETTKYAETFDVSVTDPDTYYSSTATTCVNESGDSDFTGAPDGCRQISTDDISTVTQYATAGNRILFKRGSSWTVSSSLSWPNNSGPVTIGAYGTGTNPDSQGIYDNAPQITVTGDGFMDTEHKRDWRIMDLHLIDTTRTYYSFSGATNMQRHLYLRLNVDGFASGINWSHWNDSDCTQKDGMVIASCNVSDSNTVVVYVGSERLALLGNIIRNSHTTHTVRVWQAYRSVISHNIISGSSITSGTGRQALKFHGPGIRPEAPEGDSLGTPVPGTGILSVGTEYNVISDNIFGASGPWPVSLGPQNLQYDERISNVIFERNRFHSDYGTQSSVLVQVALNIWGNYFTVRNNIFDGTGSDDGYCAIRIPTPGNIPIQENIKIYNNTIYRGDATSSTQRGILVEVPITDSIVQNNLVSFPYETQTTILLDNQGNAELTNSNNLMTDVAGFVSPNDENPLDRDFQLQVDSSAINQGTNVPVYEDFNQIIRSNDSYDIGAFEYIQE